ncbi:LysR family transcriptional regulator [Neptuniibacter caesariensis]|nr:LysR family transcriptional regulator [Neptuniibacter caesariensis]
MSEMNLRSVDLNLLVVLQALIDEQHVSKAAERLNMSQPAVSRALQRLRTTLQDPILVRTGSGYDLSARAVVLREQLSHVLHEVQAIMQPEQFDPMQAEGVLKLTGLDLELILLMPDVIRMLREKAPNLRVEVVPQLPEHFELLERGDVHFTITGLFPQTHHDQYRRIEIARTGHVCVMDRDNPLAKGELSLQDYANASHGLVSITGKGPGMMDDALGEFGYKRKVMLRLANFMSVAQFCQQSDLIFTLPKIMATHLAQGTSLVLRPLPKEFALPEVVLYMYWHDRYHHDPMCSWVRAELAEIFSP